MRLLALAATTGLMLSVAVTGYAQTVTAPTAPGCVRTVPQKAEGGGDGPRQKAEGGGDGPRQHAEGGGDGPRQNAEGGGDGFRQHAEGGGDGPRQNAAATPCP